MPLSDADRDLMIRTVIGEAGDQSPQGQAAVANVILNRTATGQWGNSPSSVVLSPGQFEPWQTRSRELLRISPQSPQYQAVGKIVDGVASGAIPDPTNGATHFLDPNVRARRGGSLPDWARGANVTIGDHQFFAPDNPNYGDGGIAAINAAIGASAGKPTALAYTDASPSTPAASGDLFRDAGFNVPTKGTPTKAVPSAPSQAAPSAPAPSNAPGSLFRDAGFTLPGQASPQPNPAALPADAPPGAVSTVSVPGSSPYYIDAKGNIIKSPSAPPPSLTDRIIENRSAVDPLFIAASKAGDIWAATKEAFNNSVAAVSSGMQSIHQGNYLPSLGPPGPQQPVTIHGLTGDYQTTQATYPQAQLGGVLKTALGAAGVPGSLVSGPINALVEQPVSNIFGPDVGARAGVVAGLLTAPELGGASTAAAKGVLKGTLPSSKALTTLVNTIGPENVPGAIARLEANPRLTLMDVSDPVRLMAQGLIDPAQPTAQNILTRAVKQRMVTAPAAVDEAYTSAMGPSPSVLGMVEQLKQRAQDVGAKMIQPALENAKPVDVSSVIANIDKELKPGVQAVASPGLATTPSPLQQELLSLRAKLVDENGSQIFDPGKLHQVQSDLRAEAQNLLSSSTGSDRNLGGKLMAMRNQIVNAIDEASPQVEGAGTYKPGLAKYRDAKMVDQAFQDGFDVTKNRPGFVGATEDSPEAMAQWLLNASPEEIAAKQLGARASIAHDMGRTRFAARVGSDIPQSDYNAQKIQLLFGRDEGSQLLQSMNDVRDEAATNSKILQGSKTAETLAGREALKVPQVGPFKIGALTSALLPPALTEIAAYYAGLPPGITGPALLASGVAGGAIRKGAQSIAKQSALARNVAFAKAASATGQAREGVLTALAAHPKVISALQKSQNALTVP